MDSILTLNLVASKVRKKTDITFTMQNNFYRETQAVWILIYLLQFRNGEKEKGFFFVWAMCGYFSWENIVMNIIQLSIILSIGHLGKNCSVLLHFLCRAKAPHKKRTAEWKPSLSILQSEWKWFCGLHICNRLPLQPLESSSLSLELGLWAKSLLRVRLQW